MGSTETHRYHFPVFSSQFPGFQLFFNGWWFPQPSNFQVGSHDKSTLDAALACGDCRQGISETYMNMSYIYIQTCIYVYAFVYGYTCRYVGICILCVYIYICVCVCTLIFTHIYIYRYIDTYIYIYIYMYTSSVCAAHCVRNKCTYLPR